MSLLDDDAIDAASSRRASITAGLNTRQLEAVTADAAVLRIIAGAGSGKTRVLTRRIARRVDSEELDPRRVLTVTFTRKAAAELRNRLGQLGLRDGVSAGTFHAVALTQLRQRWDERRIQPPELLDRKVGFVARLMRARTSTEPLDVVSEIEWAKARMISAAEYPAEAHRADRRCQVPADRVAEVFAAYEARKLKERLVDFDDLLRLACRDLEADAEYAAARRWRFRHLFVDEFQDVNPLQFRLLQAWVGDEPDLCIVGDPNQAIYGWNGADASYLEHLERHFSDIRSVELNANYRSSPQIIGLANTVLSQTTSRRFDLQPNRPDGPVPRLQVFADETAEAQGIARLCRDRHRPGTRWNDQAVLVRTNAQLVILDEAFTAAGIPHRSRGGTNLLDQPEIKDALRVMPARSVFAHHLNDLDRSIIDLRGPEPGLTNEDPMDPAGFESGDPAVAPSAAQRSPVDHERAANLAELVRLGREFQGLSPEGSVADFLAWARSALHDGSTAGNGDAVELVTFHAAKGLEWPSVIIAGLEDGLVPISHARTAEAVGEEHRLLYVALTRAETDLTLTRAERRTFGSKQMNRRPSPHLETVELALEMLRTNASPINLSEQVTAARARLRQQDGNRPSSRRARGAAPSSKLSGDDQVLMDELRRWRLDLSRANDVPAFVIFNDATLEAIVSAQPTTKTALLRVSGIGAVKAERFGDDVLRLVSDAANGRSEKSG